MSKILIIVEYVVVTIILSAIALLVSLFDKQGRALHRMAQFWAKIHLMTSGIQVSVTGLENISSPPYIFMCNHQSALDIFSLLNSLPVQFKWIAKRELFYIPFLGWAMKRAGYISLDRKHPREAIKAMDDAAKKIREGTNIIIFPEGTRSKDGHLLPFKKGGFSLALRAKVPIVPVGISGSNRLQPKGSFIPNQKGVIYLRIGKPVETAQGSRSAKTEIMMTVRQAIEGLMTEKEA
ncbi:MAG TPA: lysophospholipid acyltransferase family protein [Syntrophorhabdus sp.]|jgi:1-acyl-sn-glycerol-3-phosphate acyltransferase|nr:1-acyl-sn-glycerol-3-phosphate acyltransferase [Syntrophorhabdus sp.]OPX92947.1 MAG: 1-acyl-sn-glycerol-3-phosphate acyltransferase [Syntrophorhabdus sp. PtaB.Bin027]OQB76460.1 MAG: 1-acyl-sn-glycerol-3-phosphate acyltransferase [Deltaproteobacteria bacterium ADurb.Bin135]HNS78910.1 lysophospholipid acyltransferase family protein [Syntrophorhabdus sp.]HOD76819.1 lysophospholipid acyltransferase family protein [Syntrophorhabdus sp.]